MADIFDDKNIKDSSGLNLCEVFLLYFDEMRGHMPLLSYPDEKLIYNPKAMRPINIHSIWFLDFKEQEVLDHVDLEYKNKIYSAKKFLVKSERKKQRAGLKKETPETIVIIVALPNEIEIFGSYIIKKLLKIIQKNYGNVLWKLIEGEIAKSVVIKNKSVLENIKKSDGIKQNINFDIHNTILKYFGNVLMDSKSDSIKKQKAMSFLALKGFYISSLKGFEGAPYDDVNLFEKAASAKILQGTFNPFKISEITLSKNSQELEVVIENSSEGNMHSIQVTISHVREFFEKEILNEFVDEWYPHEDLLFVAPLYPHIDSYILNINQKDKNLRIFSKLIEIKKYM